jgi:hypothetical protein
MWKRLRAYAPGQEMPPLNRKYAKPVGALQEGMSRANRDVTFTARLLPFIISCRFFLSQTAKINISHLKRIFVAFFIPVGSVPEVQLSALKLNACACQ